MDHLQELLWMNFVFSWHYIGKICLGKWGSPHSWRDGKATEMRTGFRGDDTSADLGVGLSPRAPFQPEIPQFCDSWDCRTHHSVKHFWRSFCSPIPALWSPGMVEAAPRTPRQLQEPPLTQTHSSGSFNHLQLSIQAWQSPLDIYKPLINH